MLTKRLAIQFGGLDNKYMGRYLQENEDGVKEADEIQRVINKNNFSMNACVVEELYPYAIKVLYISQIID